MIENSDNGAETLLLQNIDEDILNDAYRDLNIDAPGDKSDFTISAQDYSTFLRILYNATYLSEVNSEELLSIMSKTKFKDGLSAGVPEDILIAQKYGESVDIDPKSKAVVATELHDCGIVYYKIHPYELCVMTKANRETNQKQLTSIIQDISNITFNYINSSNE